MSGGGGGDGAETAGHSHALSADQWCSCQKRQKSLSLPPLWSQLNILHSAQNKCLILPWEAGNTGELRANELVTDIAWLKNRGGGILHNHVFVHSSLLRDLGMREVGGF